MPEEFYIREPKSETSKGPYTIDQLQTLAEAKQIDPSLEFYNEDTEEWSPIEESKDLMDQVFPVSKKLKLKSNLEEEIVNAKPNPVEKTTEDKSINVSDMLAAAEGKTEDTKFLKNQAARRETAMSLLPNLLGLCLLLSGITLLLMQSPEIIQGDFNSITPEVLLSKPMMFIAAFDIIAAIISFLAVTAIFPLIRVRALVLMGYLGFNYYSDWTNGAEISAYIILALIIYNFGLYFITVTRNLHVMIFTFLATILSIAGFAYTELAELFIK